MPNRYAKPESPRQTGKALSTPVAGTRAARLPFGAAGILALALLAAFLLGGLTFSAPAAALPVSLEQARGGFYLAGSALYLPDQESALGIEQAGSPLLQSQYVKLSEGIPLKTTGTLWLRFSVIHGLESAEGGSAGSGDAAAGGAGATAASGTVTAARDGGIALRLPEGSPSARMFVAREISPAGEIRSWREIPASEDGSFKLPDPRRLPLTVYVKLASVPGPWFNPQISGADQGGADAPGRYLPWFLCGVLGFGVLVLLMRGLAGRSEWRLWASAVIGCALVQAVFLRHASDMGGIYLAALPQLLAPGLAIMLAPHVGRHLMHSRDCKPLDYLLIFFSLFGVAAALLPLVPGLGWTAKLLPLAPLLLLPVLLTACLSVLRGRSGSLILTLLCLLPLAGAALAAAGLASAMLRYDFESPLYLLGPTLPLWGYAAAGLLMAFASPRQAATAEKGDFFPLNVEGEAHLDAYRTGEAAPDGGQLLILPVADGLAPPLEIFEPSGHDGVADDETWREELVEAPVTQISSDPGSIPGLPGARADGGTEQQLPLPGAGGYAAEAGAAEETAGDAAAVEQTGDADESAPGTEKVDLPEGELIYIRDREEPGLTIIKPRSALSLAELHDITEPEPPFAVAKRIPAAGSRVVALEASGALEKRNSLSLELTGQEGNYHELRQNLDDMRQRHGQAENLTESLEVILEKLGDALARMDRITAAHPLEQQGAQSIFNLSNLIRKAHAEVLPLAEARGVTLSWFVSPALPLLYKGDEDAIRNAITYMLQGAVESAEAGAVQLSVRQSPEGGEGFIRFSLTDSSMSPNSMRKPARLLSRAWELARASQGAFSIEFVPSRGTSIHFSLQLRPLVDDEEAWTPEPSTAPRPPLLPWDEEQQSLWTEPEQSAEPEAIIAHDEARLMPQTAPEREETADHADAADEAPADSAPAAISEEVAPVPAPEDEGPQPEAVPAEPAGDMRETAPMESAVTEEAADQAEYFGPAPSAYSAGEPTLAAGDEFEGLIELPVEAVVTQADRPESDAAPENVPEGDLPSPLSGELAETVQIEELPLELLAESSFVSLNDPESPPLTDGESATARPALEPETGSFAEPLSDDTLTDSADEYAQAENGAQDRPDAALERDAALEPGEPDTQPAAPEINLEQRTNIVIADMAASGRRLIERRLSGLPHVRVEARSPQEIVSACAGHTVSLIILDADLPEEDVREALLEVNQAEARLGLPAVPSLCIISHSSQEERMLRAGCTACQVKTASRPDFQELVLKLAPHPAAQPLGGAGGPADHPGQPGAAGQTEAEQPGQAALPLNLNLERAAPENRQEALTDSFESSKAAADAEMALSETARPVKIKAGEKPDRSVPMLDLIVSSLDAESAEAETGTSGPDAPDAVEAARPAETGNPMSLFDNLETGSADNNPTDGDSRPDRGGPGNGGHTGPQTAEGDDASASATENGASETEGRTRLSGLSPDAPAEYMDSSMLALVPGFLEVLQETIIDLAKGVNTRNAELVREVSSRMRGQGKTFGLSNLERMASCVERAAEAGDQEAIGDLAEELLNLSNRYLTTLRLTHQDWEKSAGAN